MANFLMWYHLNVQPDDRIVAAVRTFNRVLTTPELAKHFGMVDRGAASTWTTKANKVSNFVPNDILTSLAGRALAEMLGPGIDSDW